MTNEIKEILEMLQKYGSTNDKVLLDYITNLQEENERLKNLYINEKSHKIDYDYFKVLYSKADKDIVIDDLVYKCEQCRILYDSAEKKSIENMNLQQRIDKAVEYIINHTQSTAHLEMDTKSIKHLLNILRGDE